MKTPRIAALLVVVAAACSNPPEEPSAPEPATKAPPKAPTQAPPPVALPTDAAPAPDFDSMSAEQLELARKTAILEERYDDAVRICAAEGMADKGDQVVLGCVLSACRLEDAENARAWAKQLSGALADQAKTICAASKVGL